MEAPLHIREKLQLIDRHLFLKWHPKTCRWELWRRNPIKPNRPPERVRVWCEPDGTRNGAYLPLDNRLIRWLYEADVQRKFRGRDERYLAKLLEEDMIRQEEELKAEKKKKESEEFDALYPELECAVRYDLHDGRRTLPAKTRKSKGVAL